MIPFNYLVTVHNKEALLKAVLDGIIQSAQPNSRLIIVLDGCTDGSEGVARRFATTAGVETRVVLAPNVHEIRSINIGLREAKSGYCVIVQDDVILNEPKLESLVTDLCSHHGQRLGYISFRLAVDIKVTPIIERVKASVRHGIRYLLPISTETNLVGYEREVVQCLKVPYYTFNPRMSGVKSPVCITPELRKVQPFLDEHLAPYCYDDVDLSLAALKSGLINGLFPIKFQSDLEWGGTRKDPNFSSLLGTRIRLRNRRLIWQKHGRFIRKYRAAKHGLRFG